MLTEWLQKNSWTLIIAGVTIASSYALYGYRITQLENRESAMETKFQQTQNAQQQDAITLAVIQKDIEYIKLQVNRIYQTTH